MQTTIACFKKMSISQYLCVKTLLEKDLVVVLAQNLQWYWKCCFIVYNEIIQLSVSTTVSEQKSVPHWIIQCRPSVGNYHSPKLPPQIINPNISKSTTLTNNNTKNSINSTKLVINITQNISLESHLFQKCTPHLSIGSAASHSIQVWLVLASMEASNIWRCVNTTTLCNTKILKQHQHHCSSHQHLPTTVHWKHKLWRCPIPSNGLAAIYWNNIWSVPTFSVNSITVQNTKNPKQ